MIPKSSSSPPLLCSTIDLISSSSPSYRRRTQSFKLPHLFFQGIDYMLTFRPISLTTMHLANPECCLNSPSITMLFFFLLTVCSIFDAVVVAHQLLQQVGHPHSSNLWLGRPIISIPGLGRSWLPTDGILALWTLTPPLLLVCRTQRSIWTMYVISVLVFLHSEEAHNKL